MGREDYIILNYNDVIMDNIVLSSLKYDEIDNKNYIQIKYNDNNKKKSFHIQSPKVFLEKLLYMDTCNDNILDVVSKDKIFKKFIRKLEKHILDKITELFNNNKLNLNYKNKYKLQNSFVSNILINDKIRMSCSHNDVSFFNYNKKELSFNEFIDKLTDESFIYSIFNLNNIYFDNNFYSIDFNIKQIQLCKSKKIQHHKLPNYEFLLNETIADETAFYDDDLDKHHTVNHKKVCIDSPDSSSNEKITVKSTYNSDNNNTDNEEVNKKLIEKNNLLNKIMRDLESS